MAGTTLPVGQQGIYELAIDGNSPTVITVETTSDITANNLTVTHHRGDNPLYITNGTRTSIKAGDPGSQMILPSTWLETDLYSNSRQVAITVVTATPAVISVART